MSKPIEDEPAHSELQLKETWIDIIWRDYTCQLLPLIMLDYSRFKSFVSEG